MSGLDKFQMVDPTDPHSTHNAMMGGTEPEPASLQEAVKQEVDDRMHKAAAELQAKYAAGQGGQETSVDGPTGAAYTAAAAAEQERRRAMQEGERQAQAARARDEAQREAEVRATYANQRHEEGGDGVEEESDSDAEFLDELEGSEDPVLRKLRDARIAEMKAEHAERIQQRLAGHGELREIVQDEFLPEIKDAPRCVVHFFHDGFNRCKIMDHHLRQLAHAHMECKFLRINAEKAPFFTEKLNVRVLPTVICFFEGITKPNMRQIGFAGLSPNDGTDGDDWPTSKLAQALGKIGAIDYVKPPEEEELRKYGLLGSTRSSIRESFHQNRNLDEIELDA